MAVVCILFGVFEKFVWSRGAAVLKDSLWLFEAALSICQFLLNAAAVGSNCQRQGGHVSAQRRLCLVSVWFCVYEFSVRLSCNEV